MAKQADIKRKITAGFILALFAFCTTPKKLLHDLIATHKDSAWIVSPVAQVQHAGFHCNVDDQVVSSPFWHAIDPLAFPARRESTLRFADPVAAGGLVPFAHTALRGPPVKA